MRRNCGWIVSIALLASCSKECDPPEGQAPAAATSGELTSNSAVPVTATPSAKPSSEKQALPALSKSVDVIHVAYKSTSPDSVVLNGTAMKLDELPAAFKSAWLTLSPAAAAQKPDRWSPLKIEVDGATRFELLRRIMDAAGVAGALHAVLTITGNDKLLERIAINPLRIDACSSDDSQSSNPLEQRDQLALQLKARENGELLYVSLSNMPALGRDMAVMLLPDEIAKKVADYAKAKREAPLALLMVDDTLRVDQLALIIAACENSPTSGLRKNLPTLKSVCVSPLPKPATAAVPPTPAKSLAPSVPEIPPAGPPVAQIIVQYDSKSPDTLTVNGNALELAALDQKLPGEFRRLDILRSSKPPFPYSTLRIEVDAATPSNFVRRLHDVLETAGARQAELVVEGFAFPTGANPKNHPLNLEFPAADRDLGPFAGGTEVVEVRVKSTGDGRTESVQVSSRRAFSNNVRSEISKIVAIRAAMSADAGQAPPKFAVLADDGLRADELAAILFACQYRLDTQLGSYTPILKNVSIAPFSRKPQEDITQKLKDKLLHSENLSGAKGRLPPMFPTPTPTRRGLGLSNPDYNQNPAGNQLKIPPQ